MPRTQHDCRCQVGSPHGNPGGDTRGSRLRRLSLLALALFAAPSIGADAPERRLHRLHWLTGCWAIRDANREAQLQWLRPLGGSMIGMSRTVVGGIMVSYGYLRIEEGGGQLRYVVHLAAQPEAALVVAGLTDDAVVFGGAGRDYPQRVRYERQPDGSLLVQVEGVVMGRRRVDDFPYDRVACDAPAVESTDREVTP